MRLLEADLGVLQLPLLLGSIFSVVPGLNSWKFLLREGQEHRRKENIGGRLFMFYSYRGSIMFGCSALESIFKFMAYKAFYVFFLELPLGNNRLLLSWFRFHILRKFKFVLIFGFTFQKSNNFCYSENWKHTFCGRLCSGDAWKELRKICDS